MKKQHYMTIDERYKLEVLYNEARMPVAQIAKILGFCRQTIYNELQRGSYKHNCGWYDQERYSAQKAEKEHKYAQSAKGRPLKIGNDREYAAFLEKKIVKDRYSPAAALAAARKAGYKTSISVGTLYSYIDNKVFLKLSNKNLWIKSKKKVRKSKNCRIIHPKLPSIVDRPEYINDRTNTGHWEMDLIVGKAGSHPVLLTLTERYSRQEMIFKLPNRKAATVCKVFDQLEQKIPTFKEKFKSITTDNGSEFMVLQDLQRSIFGGKRFDVWYCHSYAAWEKGTNENHNRMIRRWFPKGTDFTEVSPARVQEVQNWMNEYPRKILNWKTPNEMTV